MTIARKEIINDAETGAYHCISRCIRRAFLCGVDKLTGRDYSHRKQWMQSRIAQLSSIFCVDTLGYSILSNHVHLVLRNRPDLSDKLSDRDVAIRWLMIYPGKYLQEDNPEPDEAKIERILADEKRIDLYRHRLSSISWFMKSLKEPISRKANIEDECKGAFWESRFKCTRLLDPSALLTCMAYVDLNPVRAGIASTPETSEYTSVKCRCDARNARKTLASKRTLSAQQKAAAETLAGCDQWLASVFRTNTAKPGEELISATFDQYLQLLDWTGRMAREDKRGAIPADLRPVLERLEIDIDNWQDTIRSFGKGFCHMAGTVDKIRTAAQKAGRRFYRGVSAARQAFASTDPAT